MNREKEEDGLVCDVTHKNVENVVDNKSTMMDISMRKKGRIQKVRERINEKNCSIVCIRDLDKLNLISWFY